MGEVGDAISAEGLYRSAIDDLEACSHSLAGGGGGGGGEARDEWSPAAAVELSLALSGYGALLSRLQWNGKARTAEGRRHLDRAAEVRAGACSQLFAPHASDWGGGALEPWHTATLADDYFELLRLEGGG
mmetsp:Transcript_3125/g.9888  ORF Transcript_3125/g.9888 Transcript_3125/m.9888 type:complete len:130 (+) Transcript_3125:152-541(+)